MIRRRLVLFAVRYYYPKVHAGVAEYARKAGWHLNVVFNLCPERIENWHGDGIITQVRDALDTRRDCDFIADLDQPRVLLRKHVVPDERRIGFLAAKHFMDRGFHNFAVYGPGSGGESLRAKSFREAVPPARHFERIVIDSDLSSWIERKSDIEEKLRSAPKPLAVLATNDGYAAEVLKTALDLGFRVPEDVSILGVDNNELICSNLPVPLSSIDNNLERVGYEVAALLDRHIDGEPLPQQPVLVPPRGVVTRRSSDVLAVQDRSLLKAIGFIKANYASDISVADVVAHVGIPRRTLYEKFSGKMDKSIAEMIETFRLEKAESLLLNTSLVMDEVARLSGFGSLLNLHRNFKKNHSQSPGQWRKNIGTVPKWG